MSRRSQEPAPETDVDVVITDSRSHLGPSASENRTVRSKAARLQTIQELVRSHGYHVPAMLVAERMVEQAVAERNSLRD